MSTGRLLRVRRAAVIAAAFFGLGCAGEVTAHVTPDASTPDTAVSATAEVDATPGTDLGPDASTSCGLPTACAALWEERASARLQTVSTVPTELMAFLTAVPKGGDLHNHLNGAVYAETYLDWAREDGNCVVTGTHSLAFGNKCTTGTLPVPTEGDFYNAIIRAWSMQDFVPGAETGHDHFFATFGKYGLVAGAHRDDSIADVLTRAAEENVVYVETMFNLGKNVGTVAASLWSGSVKVTDLPALYDALIADSGFSAAIDDDVNVVSLAATGYRKVLGCATAAAPPAACDVGVRFIAQVARTGPSDTVFGQLVSAYEMAARSPHIVGANLSSPEDDPSSLTNYALHMAMLDFLYHKYTLTKKSPLHITLHAGELVPKYLPAGFSATGLQHVRDAVEVGHAERIGHGVDVLSDPDPEGLMAAMRERGVLVEVCLSSNIQILEVSGSDHPLGHYLVQDVPVALATDDQGVSRSSMAGEYARGVRDQKLTYRQLKRMARDSLEHAFLPGASLWESVASGRPVAACLPTDTMAVGGPPNATCQPLLNASERARTQWELERRFLDFESKQ